jgi:hypothetical protein
MRSFTLNLTIAYVVFEDHDNYSSCKSFSFWNSLLANVEIKVLISCNANVMSYATLHQRLRALDL